METHEYTPLRNGVPSRTSPSLSATLSLFHAVMAPQHVLGERRWLSSDAAMWYSVPAILIVDEMFKSQGMFCETAQLPFNSMFLWRTDPTVGLDAVAFGARHSAIELLGHARRHVDLVEPRIQRRKVANTTSDRVLHSEAVESHTPATADRRVDLQPVATRVRSCPAANET